MSISRPWFVETASPTPKDIVLVMDKSDSMQKIAVTTADGIELPILRLAIEAAKNVLSTLNANDRVRMPSAFDPPPPPPPPHHTLNKNKLIKIIPPPPKKKKIEKK